MVRTMATSGAGSVTAADTNPAPPTIRYYRVESLLGSQWMSPYTTALANNTCTGAISSYIPSGTVSGPFGVATTMGCE